MWTRLSALPQIGAATGVLYQDTIPGPTEDQTQDQFEESFIESDECYWGGEVYETCPYFDEHGCDSIDVYLGGDNHIRNQEEPIFTTSDWSQFKSRVSFAKRQHIMISGSNRKRDASVLDLFYTESMCRV